MFIRDAKLRIALVLGWCRRSGPGLGGFSRDNGKDDIEVYQACLRTDVMLLFHPWRSYSSVKLGATKQAVVGLLPDT